MADQPKPRMERFTMLEASGPINPSPEELATRVVGLRVNEPASPRAVSPVVLNLVAQLTIAMEALDPDGRAAALHYISNEFAKRLAG